MAIIYLCRHCKTVIGKIEEQHVSSSMLGLDTLTASDKQKMIHYQANGDIHIHSICESCEDTLKQHPNYYELDHFLQ